MGWERGRYYTRSRKVNGHVVREYVGGGEVGTLVAQLDALDREERDLEREAARAARDELATLDEPLNELGALANRLVRISLLVAGYRVRVRRGHRLTYVPRMGSFRPSGSSSAAGSRLPFTRQPARRGTRPPRGCLPVARAPVRSAGGDPRLGRGAAGQRPRLPRTHYRRVFAGPRRKLEYDGYPASGAGVRSGIQLAGPWLPGGELKTWD
jgi:hypothetical protein